MVQVFEVPGTVVIGRGAAKTLGEHAQRLGWKRVLFVTDQGMTKLGQVEPAAALLRAAGCAVTIYDQVQPDPTDTNVAEGLAMLRASGCEGVVTLGGGSPLDAGKVIAVAATNPEPIATFMGIRKIAKAGLPLIAIPTTAGTGSEVTKVAVITDTARSVKMMMLSPHLLPAVALVDYELTMSMPRPLTAAVGVDTLTHGMEAYVSRKAGPVTDPIALSCVRLCAKYLRRAWNDGGDHEARAAMMVAACQGGMAFANRSVALVHGMSRPIGAYFHLPHGLSNAVLLPTVTKWSVPGAVQRYADIAREVGAATAADSADDACDWLEEWLENLNESLQLPRLGVCLGAEKKEKFEASIVTMASDALASGSPGNNPLVPTTEDIVMLYKKAW